MIILYYYSISYFIFDFFIEGGQYYAKVIDTEGYHRSIIRCDGIHFAVFWKRLYCPCKQGSGQFALPE